MSLVRIEVKGLKELQAQLLDLGVQLGAKTLAQAARQAFKPVLESAQALVPVDSGELKEAIRLTVVKPNASDLVISVGLRIGSGPTKGIAGIAAKYTRRYGGGLPPARRWHFIELGTAHTAAHPYLRPALDRNASAVLELLKTELAKAIAKAVAKKAAP